MKDENQNMGAMVDVCVLLWKQIDKPKNLEACRAINVYDNKYRINVYTTSHCPIYDIDKVRITQSYFARLEGENLIIKVQVCIT